MKLSMLAIGLLCTTTSFAAGTKYICKEIEPAKANDLKRTVVLTQKDNTQINEGVAKDFTLELFSTGEKTPLLTATGLVLTEDVMFTFSTKEGGAKNVNFNIYLDELNESSLIIDGQKSIAFDCE